jgi:hypothetical protein
MPDFTPLYDLLKEYDKKTTCFSEFEIADRLSILEKEHPDFHLQPEMKAEHIAFEVYETPSLDASTPFFEFMISHGVTDWSKIIDSSIIDCWRNRLSEATHPQLKARYANLLWEFSRYIPGKDRTIDEARLVIDSNLDIVRRFNPDYSDATEKLKRALSLSILNNDVARTKDAVNEILAYVRRDNTAWRFAFDWLINVKRGLLSSAEEAEIVSIAEAQIKPVDIWITADVAGYLAKYYNKKALRPALEHVLNKYADIAKDFARDKSAMLVSALLRPAYAMFTEYRMVKLADEFALLLSKSDKMVPSELKTISGHYEIPKDKYEEAINNIMYLVRFL